MMRRTDGRTTIALAIALTVIAAAAIHFGWKLSELHQTGWAGFAYFLQPNREEVVEMVPAMEAFFRTDGEVTIMIPGSPAVESEIDFGDQIESVNGIPIQEVERLEKLSENLQPGETVIYELRRSEKLFRVPVMLSRQTSSTPQMVSLSTSLISGFGFLLISVLLYAAGPRSQGAFVFFQLCLVGSLFFFFSATFEFEMNDSQGIVPVGSQLDVVATLAAYLVLALLMSNLLLHFSLVFPRRSALLEKFPSLRWWIHIGPFSLPIAVGVSLLIMAPSSENYFPLILGSVVIGILVVALKFNDRRKRHDSWRSAFLVSPLLSLLLMTMLVLATLTGVAAAGERPFMLTFMTLFFLAFFGTFIWSGAYLLLTVANFYRSYRASTPEEKRQIRWPLWGTMFSLLLISAVAIYMLVQMIGQPGEFTRNASSYALLGAFVKLGYLAIPISFGLGIQKYGLMQIDTILKKTVVYAIVTSIVIVLYLVLVGVLGVALVSIAGVQNQAVTVAATLLVAALFIPLRNRVQTFVDARFLKRQQDYEEVRRSLARITATSRNLEDFLDTAATLLRDALGVPRIAFFCREASGSSLTLRKSLGLTSPQRMEISPSSPLAQPGPRIAELEGRPIPGADAMRYGVRLQDAEGVIGVVLVSERPRDSLSNEDLDFLTAVADQLALGISSLQIRTDDLELVQARQIQRSLLPAAIPQIRGVEIATAWIPARSVGGDYYDVISLTRDKLAFCIGDVVGKGMPAALLMSGLQSAVRAIAPADSSTDVTVAGVRRVSAQNLIGGKFITFFFGTIDSNRNVEFTNAGHNEPVLVAADGSVTRLASAGAAIARMMSDAELGRGTIRLGKGDTLVLFTDGVSEAPAAGADDPEQIYGEERLVDLVRDHRHRSPEDLIGIIVDDVREFAGGDFADDLTLVVLQTD